MKETSLIKTLISAGIVFAVCYVFGFLFVYDYTEKLDETPHQIDIQGGQYLRFVFVGSSSCTFSNNEDLHKVIDFLNEELRSISYLFEKKYISTGISTDVNAYEGISYLAKTGSYDELISGASWYNLGISHYIWDSDIGYASTPQVLILTTEYDVLSNGINIFDIKHQNQLLKRYIGVQEINGFYEKMVNIQGIGAIKQELGL